MSIPMTMKRNLYKTYTKEYKLEAVRMTRESNREMNLLLLLSVKLIHAFERCWCRTFELVPIFKVSSSGVIWKARVIRGKDLWIHVKSDKYQPIVV